MTDQSSGVMSACSDRLAHALRRPRAIGAQVAGRHALIHTFLAQLRNAIFGLPGQDPCPLRRRPNRFLVRTWGKPSPFSPPEPAPSHPQTRSGGLYTGGEARGIRALRACPPAMGKIRLAGCRGKGGNVRASSLARRSRLRRTLRRERGCINANLLFFLRVGFSSLALTSQECIKWD